MSPRQPAALRDRGGQDLRQHLIATAARLLGERGSAGLSVRDIAREAHVADGVLYNYFADKDDLLAHALLTHVGGVMTAIPAMPAPGTGSVAANLEWFIDTGIEALTRVTPAFAGLLAQPGVLVRFHDMVGGEQTFTGPVPERAAAASPDQPPGGHARSLPEIVTGYLRAEQRLGRVDAAADIDAAAVLLVGAIHGQVLPRVLFSPPGGAVRRPAAPPGLAARLAATILDGIAPPGARG
jgi:AcrR family transcriptional regulator